VTLLAARPSAGPVRRSRGRVVTALAAAAAVLGLLAFGLRGGPDPAPAAPVAAPPAAPGPSAAGPGWNPTDVAWLQLMIPMDERVLRLVALAPGRSADPAVRAAAARVAASGPAELARLRALLRASGVPEVDVHAGHDLPGMVARADLARAPGLRGPAFDRLLRAGLRDYFSQSVTVARGELTNGASAPTKALAAAFVAGRTEELARLP
jgi:uncharacterized protein (DUF305 family)